MNPKTLFKSIYLGDRYCKAFVINRQEQQLRIQVDCISFLRPGTATWDYFTERDVQDGWIVFSGVDEVKIQPPNAVPNDFINDITVEDVGASDERYRITISISSVDAGGNSTEVIVSTTVVDTHLEDSGGLMIAVEN